MKNNIKKSLVAMLLLGMGVFASTPARAADWNNGTFSCEVINVELAPWYLPWKWGRWEKFCLTYTLTSPKDKMQKKKNCHYCCSNVSEIDVGVEYNCAYIGGYRYFVDETTYFKIELKSGSSKSDACQIVFSSLYLEPGITD